MTPQPMRKVVTYSCGCSRGIVGVPGAPPRPPMTCPEHAGEFVKGDMHRLSAAEAAAWRDTIRQETRP